MTSDRPGRLSIDSTRVAEVLFLVILIFMAAGPLSGVMLNMQAWVSGIFSKGSYQFESGRNLAKHLLEASARISFLEKKLTDTELELTKLRQESKDVEKLRSLLGLRDKLERRTIAADVVTRNPDNWFEQVTIDKGTMDGVQVGSAVITNQGVVGQIISTSSRASVIRLVSDPDQKVGILLTRIKQPGVLAGRDKGPAVIEFIPIGTAVEAGDKIVTLGNGGIFPSGHPVGEVAVVRRDANGTSLSIEVKLAENFYNLKQVLVIPPEQGV